MTRKPNDGDTCSTLEAARELGMAVRSVQMMVDRGDLQAWKTPGGHRRISRASLREWIQTRHTPQGAVSLTGPSSPRPALANTADAAAHKGVDTVLLIEDSRHYQNLVSLLVRAQFPQARLHVADDGIAGLALAGELRPQVLIVDILLPGIDGATLIMSLRSHAQFATSRLIVITSLDEAGQAPYRFALEGVPVVHKTRLVHELPALLAQSFGEVVRPAA